MRPAPCGLPSPIPGLLISLDGQSVHQLVEAAEQIDDGHQLQHPFIIQTQLPHRGSVNVQSVLAAVDRGHGNRNDLLRQTVKLTLRHHHRFDFVPVCLQVIGFRCHHLV